MLPLCRPSLSPLFVDCPHFDAHRGDGLQTRPTVSVMGVQARHEFKPFEHRNSPAGGASRSEANAIVKQSEAGYGDQMTTVKEIEQAIERLPDEEFAQLRNRIVQRDWKNWDAQIEHDSAIGKLDVLIEEAHRDVASGGLRPL